MHTRRRPRAFQSISRFAAHEPHLRHRRQRVCRPPHGRTARARGVHRRRAHAPPRARQASDHPADGRGGRDGRPRPGGAGARLHRHRRGDQPRRHPAQPVGIAVRRRLRPRACRTAREDRRRLPRRRRAAPRAHERAQGRRRRAERVPALQGRRRSRGPALRGAVDHLPAVGGVRAGGPVPQHLREAAAHVPGGAARVPRCEIPADLRRGRRALLRRQPRTRGKPRQDVRARRPQGLHAEGTGRVRRHRVGPPARRHRARPTGCRGCRHG